MFPVSKNRQAAFSLLRNKKLNCVDDRGILHCEDYVQNDK